MKAPFSAYLQGQVEFLQELRRLLQERYEYVSILSTDCVGLAIIISQRNKTVSNSNMTTERGTVIRVCRNGQYSEYAFDELPDTDPVRCCEIIGDVLDAQLRMSSALGVESFATDPLEDEPWEVFVEKEAEILPEEADVRQMVEEMTAYSDLGMQKISGALDCQVRTISTHISKMFLTEHRYLRQSYVYSETSLMSYARREDGEIKFAMSGVSGCCGPELNRGLEKNIDDLAEQVKDLLSSGKIEPGEYEIITDPEVTGLIAHEAFGHGVEMDMFVKGRALGAEYIGKRVGSDLVTMHEGALCDDSVTAYVFDDEGTPAGDVIEIDKGILRTGICDALAAKRLGGKPTGNGKRENFAHKVYTRMTNTVFDSGDNTLEEMVSSVKYGYFLKGMESGMEDPKHWGIQCIIARGYEIRDGKLTGRVVSPVIMTGYVPDLLGGISMASSDREIRGNGACGKGHKEWVKVADGGPYLKTKARLG